jgi:hypothetical protein
LYSLLQGTAAPIFFFGEENIGKTKTGRKIKIELKEIRRRKKIIKEVERTNLGKDLML